MASVQIAKVAGKQYVYVVESFRNENGQPRMRRIENHGLLEAMLAKDPEALDKLRERVTKENELRKTTQAQLIESEAQQRIKELEELRAGKALELTHCPRFNLGSAVLWKIWKELTLPQHFNARQSTSNIEYPYGKTAFLLSNERILQPGSKKKAFESKGRHIVNFDDVDDINSVYRVLDQLASDKELIVKRLNLAINKALNRDLTVALYDVTTYSFESRTADELRDFGLSKDHRSGEVQVVMGLVVDQFGIPVDYELFPGNTAEFGTMLPIIKRFKETYNIKRCIVVADRGLNSNENLLGLLDLGCDFILAQKIKNCPAEIEQRIFDGEDWINTYTEETGEITYRFKELPVTKEVKESKISQKTGKKYTTSKTIGTLDVKWVVSYSATRAHKDLTDLDRAVTKAEKAIQTGQSLTSTSGFRSLITIPKGKGKATLNSEKIAEARRWAGYYGICTNIKDLSADKITQTYRQLWQIEDCFRVSKTNLEMRPCFVWTKEHILGHFMSCFISLVIEKYLLHRMKAVLGDDATVEKLSAAMRTADVAYMPGSPTKPLYARLFEPGLFDEICKLFEIQKVDVFESRMSLSKKLGLRQLSTVL